MLIPKYLRAALLYSLNSSLAINRNIDEELQVEQETGKMYTFALLGCP